MAFVKTTPGHACNIAEAYSLEPSNIHASLVESGTLPFPRYASPLGQVLRTTALQDDNAARFLVAAFWIQQGWAERRHINRSGNPDTHIRFATAEAVLSCCTILHSKYVGIDGTKEEYEKIVSSRAEVEYLIQEASDAALRAYSSIEEVRNSIGEKAEEARNHLDATCAAADRALSAANEGWQKAFDATLNAYKHKLQYEAPVSLWATLRDGHLKRANCLLTGFVSSIFLAIGGGAVAAYHSGGTLSSLLSERVCEIGAPTNCTIQIKADAPLIIGGLLLGTSLLLWLLRFLNKLYLSERHLGLDASQRKAFAETYLALIQDQTVDREHEAIVLAALFRSSGDGIIRDDDGGIDVSAAALLSRFIQPRS